MISKEGAIRKFVRSYIIDVPKERFEQEYGLCLAEMNHNLVYSQMAGSSLAEPDELQATIANMKEELKETAFFNIKEELVIRDVIRNQEIIVTPEERLLCAEGIAERQNTDLAFVKRFFGENLSLLDSDIKRQKAEDWIYEEHCSTQE